jgi:hypothetical protein
VIQELHSAREIIRVLQEDTNANSNFMPVSMPVVRGNLHGTSKQIDNSSLEWVTNTEKSNKARKNSQKQSIPVIPLSNRYSVLDNLQNNRETSSNIMNQYRIKFPAKLNKIMRCPNIRKKKIILIGDSNMRGCAKELTNYLGSEYEITGTIMPGSRLVNVTQLANNEISSLTKKDAVIIWGGANDISRNETLKGLKDFSDFVNQRSNTNIINVTARHRYDLSADSGVNNEVKPLIGSFSKS